MVLKDGFLYQYQPSKFTSDPHGQFRSLEAETRVGVHRRIREWEHIQYRWASELAYSKSINILLAAV